MFTQTQVEQLVTLATLKGRPLTAIPGEHQNSIILRALEAVGGTTRARQGLDFNTRARRALIDAGALTAGEVAGMALNDVISEALNNLVEKIGVSDWIDVDWEDADLITADPLGVDNGSAVQESGVLRIAHDGTATTLTSDGTQRTGIGWMVPVDLPKGLDFRRHRLIVRGRINYVAGTPGVGATGWLLMKADEGSNFGNGFVWAGGGRRQAAASAIQNVYGKEDGGIGNVPGSGDQQYITCAVDEGSKATQFRTGSISVYCNPNSHLLSDAISSASRAVVALSTNRWDGNSETRYWVGVWVDTNNQSLSAFTIDFEDVQYRWIDRFPEQD